MNRSTAVLCAALAVSACSEPAIETTDGGTTPDMVATLMPTCDGKPAPLDEDLTLSFGGLTRRYAVHVPASYTGSTPVPLVFNFHGLGSNGGEQKILSMMIPTADAQGFIVVHPEGTGVMQSWNADGCCAEAAQNDVDDVGFVRAMIDAIAAQRCIDPRRVFAAGMSNGGFLSHRLACDLSDRIAAIASIAGNNVVAHCAPPRPVPVLQIHGTLDATVAYDGNPAFGFPPIEQMVTAWATLDACTDQPRQTFQKGDATCMTRSACAGGSEVVLCTIDGGGHTWPGGYPVPTLGKTSTDLNATATAWEFFTRHPLP